MTSYKKVIENLVDVISFENAQIKRILSHDDDEIGYVRKIKLLARLRAFNEVLAIIKEEEES